jgi:hypothetical protein
MLSFEEAMQLQLGNDPRFARSAQGKRIQDVLNMRPARRRRVLARMEEHARLATGFQGDDWSKVRTANWAMIFELLAKLLPFILDWFS